MPTVTFKGKIYPAWLKLDINQPITMGWINQTTNFRGEVVITLSQGEITCQCETNQFDPNDIAPVWKEAFELSAAVVNLATFATGTATVLVFDTITYPSGQTDPLKMADAALGQLCTTISVTGPSMMEALHLAVREPQIHYALHDLNEAMFFPNRQNINCARVVETIRNLIHPTGKNDSRGAAWEKMQGVLNLSPDYVKLISKGSEAHRHGNYEPFHGATVSEIMQRTWKIMDRFLQYRKRNSQPLTAPDFPLLD